MHIVIFPWLAFGHMLPNLELAERLAARGHRVSFVSTPRNIGRLRPMAPGLARLITFVALPFPRADGLPDGAEATSDVPAGKFDLFLRAFDGLAAPFSAFLDAACAGDAGNTVDWLLVDSFHHWAAAAAADRKVPCVLCLIFSATTLALFGVPRVPRWSEADATPPSIPQRIVLTFENCKLVACRSCVELEPEPMPLLSGIFGGKPVIPFGLLPPSLPVPADDQEGHDETAPPAALRWLDSRAPNSVVFVALGSEPPVTVEQLHEIALGLELAGTGFLWALKRPSGVSEEDDVLLLPPGFEERTRARGLVAMGWVPQLEVLAHGAVGAFLTHCGWSSVVEALLFRPLPLVMLPFLDEQGLNAGLMERKQLGVQVPRFGEDRSFSRDGVARSVRAVMSEEEGGRVLAANAKKMQEILGDRKRQERYVDEFIRIMRTHKD